MSKDVKNWVLTLGISVFFMSLPAVPILRAAVIPDPTYSQTWVSLWQIARYILSPMPGLQYRLTVISWIVIILLLGLSFFVNHSFSKKLV